MERWRRRGVMGGKKWNEVKGRFRMRGKEGGKEGKRENEKGKGGVRGNEEWERWR